MSSVETAFVVAGGKGSRLGDLGKENQKCMLKIWNNKPILQYVFDSLKQAGCKHFVVAVNHLKNQIIDFFGDGSKFGIEIEYVEGQFLSTYDALYHSLPKLSGKFFYMHGDILFNPTLISELSVFSDKINASCVAIINNKNVHLTHAQMDIDINGRITCIDLTERDEHFPYTFLGLGCYYKSDFIKNYDGNNFGMVEKFISQKINKGSYTYAYVYNGEWRHFETAEDYGKAKNEMEWAVKSID